uniref:Uncharacterized protein n=1 Tax=Arundo donax TaxID=35708 RepID=A0A0A9GJA4_ARUDO
MLVIGSKKVQHGSFALSDAVKLE